MRVAGGRPRGRTGSGTPLDSAAATPYGEAPPTERGSIPTWPARRSRSASSTFPAPRWRPCWGSPTSSRWPTVWPGAAAGARSAPAARAARGGHGARLRLQGRLPARRDGPSHRAGAKPKASALAPRSRVWRRERASGRATRHVSGCGCPIPIASAPPGQSSYRLGAPNFFSAAGRGAPRTPAFRRSAPVGDQFLRPLEGRIAARPPSRLMRGRAGHSGRGPSRPRSGADRRPDPGGSARPCRRTPRCRRARGAAAACSRPPCRRPRGR